MRKFYAIANTLVIVGVIFWNYYSNTGAINDKTVGDISDDLYNLFTPSGYAFAIWGLIYLLLLGQLKSVPEHSVSSVSQYLPTVYHDVKIGLSCYPFATCNLPTRRGPRWTKIPAW